MDFATAAGISRRDALARLGGGLGSRAGSQDHQVGYIGLLDQLLGVELLSKQQVPAPPLVLQAIAAAGLCRFE